MEELGHWRHYVWWMGLLVSVAIGAYTGSHRPMRLSPWLLLLGGIASMTFASITILPARISHRRKIVRMIVTAGVYAVSGGIVYYMQNPYDSSWRAIGG